MRKYEPLNPGQTMKPYQFRGAWHRELNDTERAQVLREIEACRDYNERQATQKKWANLLLRRGGKSKNVERDSFLKRTYGLSFAQYNALFEAQHGACAICKAKAASARAERLCVDHCHKSGKVRGLLCVRCNHMISRMGDDLDGVMRYVDYLRSADAKPLEPRQDARLSDVLREVIATRGLTAYALAKETGLAIPIISRFLGGQRSITLDTADALATALGLRLVAGAGGLRVATKRKKRSQAVN